MSSLPPTTEIRCKESENSTLLGHCKRKCLDVYLCLVSLRLSLKARGGPSVRCVLTGGAVGWGVWIKVWCSSFDVGPVMLRCLLMSFGCRGVCSRRPGKPRASLRRHTHTRVCTHTYVAVLFCAPWHRRCWAIEGVTMLILLPSLPHSPFCGYWERSYAVISEVLRLGR